MLDLTMTLLLAVTLCTDDSMSSNFAKVSGPFYLPESIAPISLPAIMDSDKSSFDEGCRFTLDGTRSMVSKATKIRWIHLTGANGTILRPASLVTPVCNLTAGVHIFLLKLTNAVGSVEGSTKMTVPKSVTLQELLDAADTDPDFDDELQAITSQPWVTSQTEAHTQAQDPNHIKSKGKTSITRVVASAWIITGMLAIVYFSHVAVKWLKGNRIKTSYRYMELGPVDI